MVVPLVLVVLSAKFRTFVQGDGQEQGRFYQQDGDDLVLVPPHQQPSGRRVPPQRRRCGREAVQGLPVTRVSMAGSRVTKTPSARQQC